MGCCASKGAQELYIDIPRSVSTTDEWTLRQKSFLDGCKLMPYTAACPASYPYQCLTRVVVGEGHLFAALWEGKGGSQAARHCVSTCYDVVLERLKAGDEPSAALQKAFKQMDDSFLAADLPDVVKASVGATGTMMLLDISTNRCHMARLGKAMPFATTTKGSFTTVAVEVKDLLPHSSNTRAKSAGSASASSSTQQQPGEQWEPATAGITSAIGIGCGKRDDLRKVWQQHQAQQQRQQAGAGSTARSKGPQQRMPRVTTECEVYVSQLSRSDENIIIAAEGLLQVTPPREVATLLQHFSAPAINETKHALCNIKEQQIEIRKQQEAAAGSSSRAAAGASSAKRKAGGEPVEQQDPLAQLSSPTNVASIVVHQALAKALHKFNAAMTMQQQEQPQPAAAEAGRGKKQEPEQPGARYQVPELTYQELAHLPLQVDMGAFQTGIGQQPTVQLPEYYPVGGLNKSDVHGDMGIIVIALKWPKPADAIGAAPPVTPLRPGPKALSRRPDAEWRWTLVRQHVKARSAYKRGLRKAWWQLVDDVQVAAEAAARQAEVHAWKTEGAAVKVNLSGTMVDPETPVSYLRAHTTPPGPTRQQYRQPTPSSSGRPPSSSNQQHLTTTPAGLSDGATLLPGQYVRSSGGGHAGSSSSGGAFGGSAAPMREEPSNNGGLPDVGLRSLKSSSGMRPGMVAAAVAAINSRGSPTKGGMDSPHSGADSHKSGFSTSSSFKAAAAGTAYGQYGDLSVSAVQPELYSQDLDSPSRGPDSPSKAAAEKSAWVTPAASKARGVAGGGAGTTAGWSPSGSTPSRVHGSGGATASAHKSLSLRSRNAAAKTASPAAGGTCGLTPESSRGSVGRQVTPSSGYVAGAGVTGRRAAGTGYGGGNSSTPTHSTPGRAEIGLRSTRRR